MKTEFQSLKLNGASLSGVLLKLFETAETAFFVFGSTFLPNFINSQCVIMLITWILFIILPVLLELVVINRYEWVQGSKSNGVSLCDFLTTPQIKKLNVTTSGAKVVKCCFSQRKMLKNKLSVNVKVKGQLENTDELIHKCIMFNRNCYDMVSFGFGVSCLLEYFSPSAISSSSNLFIPQGFFLVPDLFHLAWKVKYTFLGRKWWNIQEIF